MIGPEHLTKSFGALAVLDGLSLRVGRGEFVVMRGPRGAGKSTRLRCLHGLVRASGRSVTVGGIGLDRRHRPAIRKPVGFIFQDMKVHANRTVLQDVLIGRLAGTPPWCVLSSREDRRVARGG
jgi:polar amino acid transport system ATP-binding protein